MGEIAGVNTASLGGYLHSTKTRARWAEGFHDELNGHVFDLERDWLRQVSTLLKTRHATTHDHTIPDRSPPESTRTAPSRTEVSNMLLVHHRRFEEERTSPLALGTQGH